MLVNGGTVTVAAAVSVQNLTLSSPYYSGTLNGAGVLTVTGAMDWTGGSILGTGAVWLDGTTTISGSVSFAYGTIDNAGTVAFSGSGYIGASNGAVWNNLAGSTFNAQIDGTYSGSGTGTVFNNAGTVVKSAGTGTTYFSAPFNNTGRWPFSRAPSTFTAAAPAAGRSRRHRGRRSSSAMEPIPSMAAPSAPGRG